MTLLRAHIGSALRSARVEQNRTLREVAKSARVSLGYLSEVERGQKEASSELINAICLALDLSLSKIMSDVSLRIKVAETPSLSVVDDAAA
jgi:transcriptional regulator with XRE-family HTH domain